MSFSSKIERARQIAQKTGITERGHSWYGEYFVNHFSIYLSYFLWKVGISANAVTIAMGAAGLIGSVCMVFDRLWLTIAGAILWQLWFVLDCVDGEVARLSHRTSLLGVYLDRLTHIFVNPTLSLSFGVHVCLREWSPVNLVSTIILYSAFTWTKQAKRVPMEGLGIKGGTEQEGVTKYRFNKKSVLCWLRLIIVECFQEIGQMWVFPAVIILNRVVGYEITSRFLYVYTVLFLGYLLASILRDGYQIRQLDSRKASAVSRGLEQEK